MRRMHLVSESVMTRCFRLLRNGRLRRLPMMSKYVDMPVGLTKIKRAEATLLGRSSGDLANLERSELLDCAWALATVLTAAQQGVRLAPEVFVLAESVAFSRLLSGFTECGRPSQGGLSDRAEKGHRKTTQHRSASSAIGSTLSAFSGR